MLHIMRTLGLRKAGNFGAEYSEDRCIRKGSTQSETQQILQRKGEKEMAIIQK